MDITASLRVASIHRRWLEEGRHGGLVSGVRFHAFGHGSHRRYHAAELTTADVQALQGHPEVEISVQGLKTATPPAEEFVHAAEAASETPTVADVAAPEAVAEYTPDKLATEPADNATIANPKPLIKADVSGFGSVDPATLSMRVSSLGAVNAKFDPAAQTYTFQTPHKLADSRYTVIVTGKANGKKVEARWGFNVDTKEAAQPQPAHK